MTVEQYRAAVGATDYPTRESAAPQSGKGAHE
jgi:hypothetical protein